jgi:hypothetical protein
MSNLRSLSGLEEGDTPLLMNFKIVECPKLDSLPSCQALYGIDKLAHRTC